MWLKEFQTRVATHPARIAVVSRGRNFTYQDLCDRSAAAGNRIVRAQPGPRIWVAEADPLECLEQVIGTWMEHRIPVVVAPDVPADAQQALQPWIIHEPPFQPDCEKREGIIVGTSGSTGLPKMVAIPKARLTDGIAVARSEYGDLDERHLLLAVKLQTTSALINFTLAGLVSGSTVHVFPMGTPGSVLQAHMRAHRIAVISGAPSFFRLLLSYGTSEPFRSVDHITTTGEPVSSGLVTPLQSAFPNARILNIYGMTEAGRIASLSIRDPRVLDGGCGVPYPHSEIRIMPIPGIAAPAGELWLRGPTICLGYLQQDGSYAGLDAEGFLHTGDLVRPDPDGCLMHLGRMGGLVKVGGQMVNPRDVERRLAELPGIAEAMCWPELHPVLGNALAAQVVAQPGMVLDERAILQACEFRMERHMIPRSVAVVAELPRTSAGKRALRATTSN